MGRESVELRYLELKNELCRKIYEGVYQNGERIPSERQLADEYGISRITVRKAMELLEDENLVAREVGNGTKITLKNYGNQTELDVVALVAPSKNPFFVEFIAEFQKCAWNHDVLLLYVEVPEQTDLEDCLFRLYQKDIRNVVVWPNDQQIDGDKLLRLRSIGMNLVFFDTDAAYPFADSIFVDNDDAVKTLFYTGGKGCKEFLYVGWDNLGISNIRKREKAYCNVCPKGVVKHVPWRTDRKISIYELEKIISQIKGMRQGFVLCGDGEIGTQMLEILEQQEQKVTIAIIDEFEGTERYSFSFYNQDLQSSAEKIFACMERQILEGAKWKAEICPVKGRLKEVANR